jgi:hypothetical protein
VLLWLFNVHFPLKQMSSLKWLGVWGMSGSGVTTKQDKHKWTQQIENVLKDPNGIFRFEEYLRDHELQHYIPILHGECT